MYLPSMLFGGSSILHLLAGHPRLVAAFGLGAVVAALLSTPFGVLNVSGTAAYVAEVERRLPVESRTEASSHEEARRSALELRRAPRQKLLDVIDTTLKDCGAGCLGLNAKMILNDPALLDQVVYVHQLDRLHEQRQTAVVEGGSGKARPVAKVTIRN